MRFLSAALFSVLMVSTSPASAVTAPQWQSQLEGEIQRITARSPDVDIVGKVAVEDVNGQLRATLPGLVITSPDKSQWRVPPIVLLGSTQSDAIEVTLPETVTRYNTAQAPIATMRLGTQNLKGRWDYKGNYFNALQGSIQNVRFEDSIARSASRVSSITLDAASGANIAIRARDVHSTAINPGGGDLTTSVGNMVIAYRLDGDNRLTLTRLVGLFNPAILLTEGKKTTLTLTGEQISTTDAKGRTTSVEKAVSEWQLQPKGAIISADNQTQLFIVRQTPETVYQAFLPQKLEVNASADKLPQELVSFAPGMSGTMARQALAKAGTVIKLEKLRLTTFDQGVISGNGSLRASTDVPSGFIGRMTLSFDNMKQLVNTTQMKLLQPDSGANRAAATQSLMGLMLLQGMGRQEGEATKFVLDLTSEGQTLVNGQDFSGLLSGLKGGGKGGNAMPAVPVAPVSGSNL